MVVRVVRVVRVVSGGEGGEGGEWCGDDKPWICSQMA